MTNDYQQARQSVVDADTDDDGGEPPLAALGAGRPSMNPLGVRALYLGSSAYRIHGTDAPWTIGTAVSKGCIRLYNQDVLDLYPRVQVGAKVVVTWDRFNSAPGYASSSRQPSGPRLREWTDRPAASLLDAEDVLLQRWQPVEPRRGCLQLGGKPQQRRLLAVAAGKVYADGRPSGVQWSGTLMAACRSHCAAA